MVPSPPDVTIVRGYLQRKNWAACIEFWGQQAIVNSIVARSCTDPHLMLSHAGRYNRSVFFLLG